MYDGKERREGSRDHDLLTKIDEKLSNFLSRFEEHTEDDKNNFDDIKNRLSRAERFIYIGIGGLIVLEFVLKIIAHSHEMPIVRK